MLELAAMDDPTQVIDEALMLRENAEDIPLTRPVLRESITPRNVTDTA
ncbi:hypothetical protein [Clavibacter sp. VKM Ac-2542]|nr:hypothetical protein [Clavibacter sp. VKM Ac-2542]MBF4620875.1 hypothetical protein [Clavibacter sp. VKM Ac-2542]